MLIFSYLKFNPYGCIVWSVSIQNDSLFSLSFGSQWSIILTNISSIEHLCSKLKKMRHDFLLHQPTNSLNHINSHSICTAKPLYRRSHTVQDINYITSLLLQLNRKFLLCFLCHKVLNSFQGTRISQMLYLLSLQLKLPVATSV